MLLYYKRDFDGPRKRRRAIAKIPEIRRPPRWRESLEAQGRYAEALARIKQAWQLSGTAA